MNQDSYTALIRSEMEFRALAGQAAVGITETETATGRYLFVNQRFADIVGYSCDELLTMSFHELTDPDDLAEDLGYMDRLVKGDLHEYSMEKRYRRRDGTPIWVSLTVSPLWLEGESPRCVIGIVEDITERKRAEDALRESERKLREAQEMAHLGFWTWDVKTRSVEWSEEVFKIFGLDPGEFTPQIDSILALSPWPEDNHRDTELIDHATKTHSRGFYEQKFLRPDKSVGHYYSTFQGKYDENGELTTIVGTVLDITERKKAEEALQGSNELFSLFIKHSPIYSYIKEVTPTESRVLQASDNYPEMIGVLGLHMAGKTMTELFPAEFAAKITADDWAVVSKGEILRLDEDLNGRNYTTIKFPIIRGDKTLLAGYTIDITDRKRAEEEKAALQAQLFQSQKVAAIGQLAGGIAHDFNNLLTGILGNVALMRSNLSPADPSLENLNAVETAARRAAELTKGLLTFSRSAMVLPEPMSIITALNTTLTLLKQSLPATIDIVCDYGQTAWNVLLDQSQMTQILLNLAVNARDAMSGKGTLTIRAMNEVVGDEYVGRHPFARTGEFVHLSVADTGPGMSSEVMQHLFEPFYTTKPVGSGTGLGLSIVYGAVKQAGGWITAVSTEGAGTTFDIYLPRCLKEPAEAAAPSPEPTDACSGTVLVVEDEPVVRMVAESFLSKSGYDVLTAADGSSALEVLRGHRGGVGLILLDMTMPGLTTSEIVQAIRVMDPAVPILLNSGYTTNDTVRLMLDAGSVQGFLGKPYELHQLVARVRDLLKRG
ncbi:MAG TPA: PAS domain S-box protein [Clostridia bacterium]|nr:PAS domain S-box protein [Clostridia bacterium]